MLIKSAKKIHMLRWRTCGLKYEGVQDRALKLCPVIITRGEPLILTDEEELACLPVMDERGDKRVMTTHMLNHYFLFDLSYSI